MVAGSGMRFRLVWKQEKPQLNIARKHVSWPELGGGPKAPRSVKHGIWICYIKCQVRQKDC